MRGWKLVYLDRIRQQYLKDRAAHWNKVAVNLRYKKLGSYYKKRLARIYSLCIPPGARVLELGCAEGDLLNALKPAYGVGIDFSDEMIKLAKRKYPKLNFIACDAEHLNIDDTFDFIILSDIVNDLWDVQEVFTQIKKVCGKSTRIILNLYSHLWEWPLLLAQKFGLSRPNLPQNWLTREDITNLLYLADFEVIRFWQEILYPLSTPLVSSFANCFLVKMFPFNMLALTNFAIARPRPNQGPVMDNPTVSVIVPARNESGNIREVLSRIPDMGKETEIIFVEGHSKDDTSAVIEKTIAEFSNRKCKYLRQTGKGKGDAVRLGFSHASGEILMILDADISVAPEDLPKFYETLVLNKAEFMNGVRLVYPIQKHTMRFLNLVANKAFTVIFSWLLGQHMKDTLCGTKVLWHRDYIKIAENRAYFGDFDPFGDFDLLFGAAKLNLKIADLPVRYYERKYGKTNIRRWRHGMLLIEMMLFAARKIKFI
ncbi:MAG: glycosyltransferase [Candidatus Omnitrophica bacterium]|nr:glycosyltransferase [Candidatus Omnitrophota bacterium]